MISHIKIKDFAIIEDLDLDLDDGLNIITGETGAGKSIIIEAVSMALGSRADADYIRTGKEKASVTIEIDTSNIDPVKMQEICTELGVENESPMILKREISTSGKNSCRVNGETVTVSMLSKVSRRLADIHGQYDHQFLLNPENHTSVLDSYDKEEILPLLEETGENFRRLSGVRAELQAVRSRKENAERQKDILKYEINEIEAAAVASGEDETLKEEIRLMQNSETVFAALSQAHDALFSGSLPAADSLSEAMEKLESVKSYSRELEQMASAVSDAYYAVDDIRSSLRKFRDSVNFSERELDQKIERQEELAKLKRKYGGSLKAVLAYLDRAKADLDLLEHAQEHAQDLEKQLADCLKQYQEAAEKLEAARRKAAALLGSEISRELAQLNFKDAVFEARILPREASENGSCRCEFLISANRGEDLRPLAKVASGGELSRIMLAMKRITADLDGIPTLIFDEIDTGISGATAGIVGEKMKSIAAHRQVICITHLPQIACLADHSYKIFKTADDTGTRTTVVPLNGEEQVAELARLLSGTTVTEAAVRQAEALIRSARKT